MPSKHLAYGVSCDL